MAGLFDNLFGSAGGMYADMLSPEQQAQIRRQSMMQAAAKLLEGSGPSPVRRTLGQNIGSALSAGAEAVQSGQANAVQQMLLKQKLDEAKAERLQNEQIRKMIGAGDVPIDTINAPVETAGRVGPTMQRAAMPTTAVNPLMANLNESQRAVLRMSPAQKVPELLAGFSKDAAAMSEVTGQPFEVTDATGRPIMVQQTKGGKITTLEGFGPKREIVLENLGGRTVAIDKKSLKGGESFQREMTPGEQASNQVARANLAIAQNQFARGNYTLQDTDQGKMYVPTTPGAQAIPVTGPSGAPLKSAAGSGQPTQDELQTATLLARVSIAEQQIGEAARANQGASAPGYLNPLTPRAVQSAERKQVEDAQDEFLDAALTLSTGAAYTQEQFNAAKRTYFPAAGDDAQTIKDKANRRKNVIESARLRAGRSAGSIPAMPASRFDQPPAAAPIQGLGTGTMDLGNYFAPPRR
jgi:hypothetical protein